jgi:FAD/FMN-containing dehydrogenase
MIDRRPAVIVRCRVTEDVAAAVRVARGRGLEVAVRGGGHNVAGLAVSEGGMVIDLSAMNRVEVDPDRRLAVVGGGALWRDVDEETQKHGLAAPAGLVSETGVGGLTLGGGLGWLRRKHGLSCDNLIRAEVITADGRRVTASEQENPDLLWALRGGGGNFGIVTEFVFRLHPVGPEVAMALVLYPGTDVVPLLRAFREYVSTAPDEIAPLAFTGTAGEELEGLPSAIYGRTVLTVAAVYVGLAAEGDRRLLPLRQLGDPVADLSGRLQYAGVQRAFDEDYPDGRRYYWKSAAVAELSDPVIDLIARFTERRPSPLSTVDIWALGGALRHEPAGGSAYAGRAASYLVNPEANWDDAEADAANLTWARELVHTLHPHTVGTYLNFPGMLEEGERQLQAAFGDHFERLRELKQRWDPDNVFRLNHNIVPPRASAA